MKVYYFSQRDEPNPPLDEARVSKMFGKFIPEKDGYNVVNNINNNKIFIAIIKNKLCICICPPVGHSGPAGSIG